MSGPLLPSGRIPAPCTIDLRPEDFASDWEAIPIEPVPVGLRSPSEDDAQTMRLSADKFVEAAEIGDVETAIDTWNDALMAAAVSRCICDPLDVRSDSPVLPLAEDVIGRALTPMAIRRVFDRLERLMVEQSALAPEATDDELRELAERLNGGEYSGLSPTDARSLRRFARYCLDMLPEREAE